MATRQFNIFVEGNDDHDLLLALIHGIREVTSHPTKASTRTGGTVTSYLKLQTDDTLIISSTGGWSKLGRNQGVFIQEAHDSGGRTLVVFDADYDTDDIDSNIKHESGGPVKRREALLAKLAPFDPNPEIFLFPQPGRDGDLEELLLQLTQQKHQRVLDCYDGYEGCLQQFLNSDGSFYYNAPSNKRRIYDYVNVMPLTSEDRKRHQQGGQKIFENVDIWNLDAPAIQPLRDFLNQHLP